MYPQLSREIRLGRSPGKLQVVHLQTWLNFSSPAAPLVAAQHGGHLAGSSFVCSAATYKAVEETQTVSDS